MPVILVVDDSAADRALIGLCLKEEPLDWIVDFAESAEEGLVRLRELAVDVVVTDMMMPGMDGLALLEAVRRQYRRIPVILTTGQGNESLAVTALRRGAASYVPKAELAARLGETIKQVLQVAHSERSYDQLIESLSDMRVRFQLGNEPEMISPMVGLIQQIVRRMKLCGAEGCQQIGVALDEALINAIYHGNLELPQKYLNEVRNDLRNDRVAQPLEQRRSEPPYCERRVFIEAALSPLQFEITIRDEGPGFDSEQAVASYSLDTDGQPGTDRRRGLVLIHSHMDRVEFNDAGNQITMAKRREPDPTEQDALPL